MFFPYKDDNPRILVPYVTYIILGINVFVHLFQTGLGFSDTVAEGIKDVIEENLTDIVHIVGEKKISMFELAKINTPSILPMTLTDYSGPPLTIDMSLDTQRWKKYSLG